jgi:hypothetical protein
MIVRAFQCCLPAIQRITRACPSVVPGLWVPQPAGKAWLTQILSQVEPLVKMDAEFSGPAWVFGTRTYQPLSDGSFLVVYNDPKVQDLALVAWRSSLAAWPCWTKPRVPDACDQNAAALTNNYSVGPLERNILAIIGRPHSCHTCKSIVPLYTFTHEAMGSFRLI